VYSHELATFGRGEGYDQKDASGFIRLFGLPTKVFAATNPESTKDASPIPVETPAGAAGQGGRGSR
jgi:hypothetical protein